MNKFKILCIVLVLGISCFTHFYRIDHTYVFQNDEGRDALISYRMIETKRPVLLGPETSVGNMYLGPFYYYLMVPALWLSHLDPVGPAIMVAILGVATTFLLIVLGKKYGSLAAGMIAALFYALSPVMVHYSRSSWNPNVVPFFIALMLLSYPFKRPLYAISFGLLTGILFQLHYVALIIPALLGLHYLYTAVKNKKLRQTIPTTFWILLGFLVSSLPFWLFESRHNFVNIQAFMTYLLTKSGAGDLGYPPYLTRLLSNFELLISGAFGGSSLQIHPVGLAILSVMGAMFVLYVCLSGGILSYLTVASLLIISVLKESIHIHYIAFLFPIISLIVGLSLTHKKIRMRILAAVFLLALAYPTYQSLSYNLGVLDSTQPRRARETAAYITEHAQGRPYNVVNASSGSSATILYYLAISANPPKTKAEPLLFVICENALCGNEIETNPQLFLNGPAHPTIIDYLGYTPTLEARESRHIIANEWVTYDVYIATLSREVLIQ